MFHKFLTKHEQDDRNRIQRASVVGTFKPDRDVGKNYKLLVEHSKLHSAKVSKAGVL